MPTTLMCNTPKNGVTVVRGGNRQGNHKGANAAPSACVGGAMAGHISHDVRRVSHQTLNGRSNSGRCTALQPYGPKWLVDIRLDLHMAQVGRVEVGQNPQKPRKSPKTLENRAFQGKIVSKPLKTGHRMGKTLVNRAFQGKIP